MRDDGQDATDLKEAENMVTGKLALTPTLSPGEREKRRPTARESGLL